MAPQLVLQFPALVPVDPTEDLRIVFRRTAVGDAMRPVLGEAMLTRRRLQSGRADLHAHRHVRLVVLRIVAPERGQRFLHAAITCGWILEHEFKTKVYFGYYLNPGSFIYGLENQTELTHYIYRGRADYIARPNSANAATKIIGHTQYIRSTRPTITLHNAAFIA